MRFNSKSSIQPSLHDVNGLVRFKGCYLLKAVGSRAIGNNIKVRVAIFADIENTGTIEVRLLGGNFGELVRFENEYLQIEVAFKKLKFGHFFYLAWYEEKGALVDNFVSDHLANVITNDVANLKSAVAEIVCTLPTACMRDYCANILDQLPESLSSFAWEKLSKSLVGKKEEEVCIFLTEFMCRDDVLLCGYFLDLMHEKKPYQIWEKKLLGH